MSTPDISPEARAALPTFLVIGAPKAGTTSLHEYLAVHPEIVMSSNKEPMCFEPPHWVERMREYRTLFERDAAVRGESSTVYSSYPWVPEIPDRVKATIPDVKLVYIVRDPIARTLSHYAQNVWDRFPVRPFDELMDHLEHPMNLPVWASRYATQLERWIERFGQERILVLDQRDLLLERDATVRRVFEFLEVDSSFRSPGWDAEHNTAQQHRVPSRLGEHLQRSRLGRGAMRTWPVQRLATRQIPAPRLTTSQRERLAALLRPEVDRLEAITGRSFGHWSL